MKFKNVVIVGVGLMGGSLALAFKRKGFKGTIRGVSRPETIEKAMSMGVLDKGFPYHKLETAVEDADLIYLCTPIQRAELLLGQIGILGPSLKKDCLITDVGSTKLRICTLAGERLPEHLPFIGGHPMDGSEKSGVGAADPFLFENAIYAITPGKNVPAEMGQAFAAFTLQTGAKVLFMDPATHDKIAAVISHVPQLVAVALMNWAAGHNKTEPLTLQLAAGGFRDMTRIASSSYSMWKDIVQTNQTEIEKRLDELIQELKFLKIDLQTQKLEERFSKSRTARHTIPRDSKGFIHPLFEILVVADDRPGIIAGISAALAEKKININDIEIVKVREGEGGTIRLGFDSRLSAEEALRILHDLKFQARSRE